MTGKILRGLIKFRIDSTDTEKPSRSKSKTIKQRAPRLRDRSTALGGKFNIFASKSFPDKKAFLAKFAHNSNKGRASASAHGSTDDETEAFVLAKINEKFSNKNPTQSRSYVKIDLIVKQFQESAQEINNIDTFKHALLAASEAFGKDKVYNELIGPYLPKPEQVTDADLERKIEELGKDKLQKGTASGFVLAIVDQLNFNLKNPWFEEYSNRR